MSWGALCYLFVLCHHCGALSFTPHLRSTLARDDKAALLLKHSVVHARELTSRSQVRKPLTDSKEYVGTTFDTGLSVLAVTDTEATKVAFAVAVDAGSLEDPESFQGLAHFCEHMLFLGSDKYPDPEAFTNHLARYGGNHNAYTAAEATVYYNEIASEGFDLGLDIFAQFFIHPSFNRSMTNKEIHAVDSEHKKNMPNMIWKLRNLLKSRASKDNPRHKFSTGNLETLKVEPESQGLDLVEKLQSWHAENYCPSRLHLVLVGNFTADTLFDAAHKAFDPLPKSVCSPRPKYESVAFSHELGNVGQWLSLHTQGSPELWLQFPIIPRMAERYKELPFWYLTTALYSFTDGGLKAQLLKEDLSPSFGASIDSSVAGSEILLSFSLTEKGRRHPERVLELFFAYTQAVEAGGVNTSRMLKEQQLRQVTFDYQRKPSSQFNLVEQLGSAVSQGHALEDLLTAGMLLDEPNATLSLDVLKALQPRNMNVVLVDPEFKENGLVLFEPHYKFKYSSVNMSEDLLLMLEHASDTSFRAPPEPRFVPTELDLITEGSGEMPELLSKEGRVALWWQGLNGVKMPQGDLEMKLSFSAAMVSNVTGSIMAGIHSRVVQRTLESATDELQTCGMSYSIFHGRDGVFVSFSGFDQHLEKLMDVVLPFVRMPNFTEDVFEAERRKALMDVSDVSAMQPYALAFQAMDTVAVKGTFDRHEVIQALSDNSVNAATYRLWLKELFNEADLTMLVSGNIRKARASTMAQLAERALNISRTQAIVAEPAKTMVVKPNGRVEVRVKNPINGDPNSATVVAYQVGIPTMEDRVALLLLGDIIGDPFFTMLRTHHQLGYTVFGYTTYRGSVAEIRVLVQGFRKDPDTVEDLIESAVQNMTAILKAMSSSEFEARKANARLVLEAKPKTLSEEVAISWSPIRDGHGCFQKRRMMLEHLDSVGPSSVIEMWENATSLSVNRRTLVSKLFGYGASAHLASRAVVSSSVVVTALDAATLSHQLEHEEYW
eukprot:CAMPEP_0194534898 /NCGR_PEP_ID=MMETSP0253-20130528/73257_1 /TAXON_ID=2966 /ORGANISM="Noctiluca scintillans" /LENGTH=1001 /DNA_ID=CAMNT_0039380605 /DNA_START=46 /DNA_END=3048 /DNA_ORIENTATION=-